VIIILDRQVDCCVPSNWMDLTGEFGIDLNLHVDSPDEYTFSHPRLANVNKADQVTKHQYQTYLLA